LRPVPCRNSQRMIEFEDVDRQLLDGRLGPAPQRAMNLLVRYASAIGASRFISITSAHIDGCLYHGPSSIEFAQRFASHGGRVRVPTTLNSAANPCFTVQPWQILQSAPISARDAQVCIDDRSQPARGRLIEAPLVALPDPQMIVRQPVLLLCRQQRLFHEPRVDR
jgi:Aconitase X